MESEIYELVYKIEKDKNDIRLLGNEFFIRNKYRGIIVYKSRKYKLIEKIPIEKIKNINDKYLKIKMIFHNRIYNKSFMFKNCVSLISFSFQINKIIMKIKTLLSQNYLNI